MTYAAVNAKLCAMGSRLLKPQDYEAISQMELPEDIMEWLKHTPDYSDSGLHKLIEAPGQLITEAAADICRYIADKPQRDYITAMAASAFAEGQLHYYTAQWKSLSRLDKSNRAALRSTLGAEIDLKNILSMYRLKRYHRVIGDSTYGHLIPIRYRISHEATRRMADCTTPKALLDEVARCPYASDFAYIKAETSGQTEEISSRSKPTPEQILATAIERRYQLAARRFASSLAPTVAYLYKKKQEVQNLVAAMEVLQRMT